MTSYPLAQYSWEDALVITILSTSEQHIGTFPLDFVRRSGVNTWGYILDVVRQLVDAGSGGTLFASDGTAIDRTAETSPGEYEFVPQGMFVHLYPTFEVEK